MMNHMHIMSAIPEHKYESIINMLIHGIQLSDIELISTVSDAVLESAGTEPLPQQSDPNPKKITAGH